LCEYCGCWKQWNWYRGIAYGCKIVPIRMGYESPAGSGQLNTSDSWITNSFNYAWSTAGADVISIHGEGEVHHLPSTMQLVVLSKRTRRQFSGYFC
jgi:hypothetical protein